MDRRIGPCPVRLTTSPGIPGPTVNACWRVTSTSRTDPENGRRAQRAVQLAHAYHQAAVDDEGAARPLLVELLGSLGEDAFVKPPLYVDYGEHIHIGARTFINYNLTALDVAAITIGEGLPDRAKRPAAHPNASSRAPTSPGQAGSRKADHHR